MIRIGRTKHAVVLSKLVRSYWTNDYRIANLDIVVARSFTDDVDAYRQIVQGSDFQTHPGLHDDGTTKFFGKLLPVLYIKSHT